MLFIINVYAINRYKRLPKSPSLGNEGLLVLSDNSVNIGIIGIASNRFFSV